MSSLSQLSLCLWLMLLKAVPCWVVIGPIDPIRILVDVGCWGEERSSYGWYQNAKKALESLCPNASVEYRCAVWSGLSPIGRCSRQYPVSTAQAA